MCYSRKNLNKGGWLSWGEFPVANDQEKRNFQRWSRKKHVELPGVFFCGKNNLKSQDFLTSSPGWIFSKITCYCCLGCHYTRYIARAPTDQSMTYLIIKAASYINRKKLGRHFLQMAKLWEIITCNNRHMQHDLTVLFMSVIQILLCSLLFDTI